MVDRLSCFHLQIYHMAIGEIMNFQNSKIGIQAPRKTIIDREMLMR